MRKFLKLFAAILLFSSLAFGQGANCGQTNYCLGNISANAQIVNVALPQNTTTTSLTVSGTFSATLQIEQSTDGVNWTAATGTGSTTSPGQWTYTTTGIYAFRVRSSVYASGTATVSITNSQGGGGGGGSSCIGTADQILFTSSGSDCLGIPNSVVNPSTGDVMLGAAFEVNNSNDNGVNLFDNGAGGITIFEQGASFLTLYANNGFAVEQFGGDNTFYFSNNGSTGIQIDSTGTLVGPAEGTGPINLTSAGGITFSDSSTTGIQAQALTQIGPFTISGGTRNLPTASSWTGYMVAVTDSTVVAAEGQTCVHTGTSPVTALAFSNGTIWKCF